MPRGVDHGLGGKESENSKRKRAKKAHRIKTKAESRMKVHNGKREVVFDEQAREDYLTGFRKRKGERRKYGLAMQIMKETKQRKEALKQRRSDILKANEAENQKLMDRGGDLFKTGDSRGEEEDTEDEADEVPNESVFTDDNTTSMFGGSVSVVINGDVNTDENGEGDTNQNSYGDEEDEEELRRAKQRLNKKRELRTGKPLTKLERAFKKVTSGGALLKKKKKGGGTQAPSSKGGKDAFSRNKGKGEGSAAGKALLHKAMGSGIVGGFKGTKKRKGKR